MGAPVSPLSSRQQPTSARCSSESVVGAAVLLRIVIPMGLPQIESDTQGSRTCSFQMSRMARWAGYSRSRRTAIPPPHLPASSSLASNRLGLALTLKRGTTYYNPFSYFCLNADDVVTHLAGTGAVGERRD
jgi:hypothetical protein